MILPAHDMSIVKWDEGVRFRIVRADVAAFITVAVKGYQRLRWQHKDQRTKTAFAGG